MTERTKRYGGFLIGDRVRVKDTAKTSDRGTGFVTGYKNGKIIIQSKTPIWGYAELFPNQLINLTRIEEEKRRITDQLPPLSEETAKEIEERFYSFCGKHNITPPKANFNPAKEIAELKMIRGFVAEALRQTEIFLSPLPSPYTRDVYTTTKDYE